MSKRIEKIKKVINEIKIESDANFMYLKKALYR
jgi:predicted transglutaminase-like protease